MLERLSSTLDQLLACPIVTPSHMSALMEENLRGPEEKGIAKALEFELWNSNMKGHSFYLVIFLYFPPLCCWDNLFCILYLGKKE